MEQEQNVKSKSRYLISSIIWVATLLAWILTECSVMPPVVGMLVPFADVLPLIGPS